VTYAEGTSVSVERSKAELDGILARYGATQRGTFVDDEKGLAIVMFQLASRSFKIEVPLPKPEPKPKIEPRGWWSWTTVKKSAWVVAKHQQACRERWRAVVLMVKAKLELVEIGISTAEREFFADMMLPDGRRLHAALEDDLAKAYLTGGPPTLLLGMGEP